MKNISYTIDPTKATTHKTSQINQLTAALTAMFPDGKSFTTDDLSGLVENGLKTKQDPARIFAYYQNELIDMGFLVKNVTTTESAAKVSRIAQIRALATQIANDVAISDESRAAANAILELTK